MSHFKEALANGGWVVGVVAVLGALIFAAYVFNPIEEADQRVGEPVAESIGITSGRCPDGWKDVSEEDEHTLVKSCQRDGWLVVLDEEGRFQHGFQLDTPGATFHFDKREVPGWPAD